LAQQKNSKKFTQGRLKNMRGAATFRNARDLDVILDEEEEADQDNDYVTHY
jgi:hypothetical protein|tara:strand:+ start:244 stop:396 length:153 start_codon:yes stop_codon:yes gene_type:complete